MSPLGWLGCCMCLGAPSHTLFFLTQAEKGNRAHFKVSELVLLFQQCAGMSPVETWTCTRLWYLRVSAQVSIFQGPLLRGWSQFTGSSRFHIPNWGLPALLPDIKVGEMPPGSLGVCCWIPQFPHRHFSLWMNVKF